MVRIVIESKDGECMDCPLAMVLKHDKSSAMLYVGCNDCKKNDKVIIFPGEDPEEQLPFPE